MATIKKGSYRWDDTVDVSTTIMVDSLSFVIDTDASIGGVSLALECFGIMVEDGTVGYGAYYNGNITSLPCYTSTNHWNNTNILLGDDYPQGYGQTINVLEDFTPSNADEETFATWFTTNTEPVGNTPAVEITYKGEKIELSAGDVATLHIKDHKLTEDLVIKANATSGGSGSGIIEVETLPTENIDENALYKMGGSYYQYAKELKDVIALQDGAPSSLVEVYEAQFNAKFELYYADNVENIPEADRKMPNEITLSFPLYYDAYTKDVVVWVGEWASLSETLLDGMTSGGTIADAGAEIEEGRYYALIGDGWKKYSSENLIVEVDNLPTTGIEKTNLYKVDNTYFKYVNTMVDLVVATNYGQTSLVAYYESKGYTVYLHYTENYNNLAPEDIIPTVKGATAGCYYDASRNDTFVYTNDLWVSLATILAEEGLAFANGGAIPDASYARAGGYFAVINSAWQPLGAEMYTGEVVID